MNFVIFSKLVIISADNLSLVLYDLGESASVRIITYDRGVGQSLYVFDDGTIYWVIFDQSNNLFIVVCTYVTSGMTRELGIQYNTDICVVVDRSYIYVLDKDNNRIDVYSRITLVKLWELHTTTGVKELIIAFGKQTMLTFKDHLFVVIYNDIKSIVLYYGGSMVICMQERRRINAISLK